jgi:hypothetical protein
MARMRAKFLLMSFLLLSVDVYSAISRLEWL